MYMEHNMKPLTKQLAIAALILTSVTVLSFGIRQVRFSIYRANTIENPIIADTGESAPSARTSDPKDQSQPKQPLGANAEPDYHPADSLAVNTKPDPQYANASDWDEEAPPDDYSKAHTDSGKQGKAVSRAKSFKGDYAKAKGSKKLEKISLGDNEKLYITGGGELWYVNKQPEGKAVKMQVQIDNNTGEMNIVGGGDYARSEGSKGLQRISVGDREDLYMTGEGQLWYVSEQPDGSTAKMQLQTENIDGEINIVDNGKNE